VAFLAEACVGQSEVRYQTHCELLFAAGLSKKQGLQATMRSISSFLHELGRAMRTRD
jgi:hypothetical protein